MSTKPSTWKEIFQDIPASSQCSSLLVALIGSSGGGVATIGHTDPTDLLTNVNRELCRIRRRFRRGSFGNQVHENCRCSVQLKYALFVSVHGGKGLDGADQDAVVATLYTVGCDEQQQQSKVNDDSNLLSIKSAYTGTLREVNRVCQHLDNNVLAKAIDSDQISALICISCDPKNVHASSLQRCAKNKKIVVTGSGGSSLSFISNVCGIQLVGNAGGSVAATNYTRAVSHAYALARAFSNLEEESYECYYDSSLDNTNSQHAIIRPNIISVLNSCLPAFVAVAITKRVLEILPSDVAPYVQDLLHPLQWIALPTVCCVISALSYGKEHGSTVIMAAAMVGASACQGSILAALLAGYLVSRLADRVLWTCLFLDVPSTMINLLIGGGAGAIVSVVLVASRTVFLLRSLTELFRTMLHSIMLFRGSGFVIGCTFCYGSKVGWYHKYFLSCILIEMERGDASFLGAVDELTLVLVCSGICLANLVCRRRQEHQEDFSISKRAIWINLLCGDFIEVAYPFMDQSWYINTMAYVASGVSTEVLLIIKQQQHSVALSSAYVPFFVSVWLAREEWKAMAAACLVSVCISFVGGLIGNLTQFKTQNLGKND
mmetsp:Transcript_6653/g.9658  ORF Transcript_6653/g.9658 Transcript_6653/m.9658 type:complete len:603 (-) Transcript_6653:77-1885(-)